MFDVMKRSDLLRAGAVDQNIDPAELGDDSFHQLLELREVRDVRGDRENLDTA